MQIGGYKYHGILQVDQILSIRMKGKITTEYIRRVKKLCKSKLNGGNPKNGLNPWAVGVARYSAGIVDWIKNERLNIEERSGRSWQ